MIILHDKNLTITGIQTFPDVTSAPHIVADDSLFQLVSSIIGYAKLTATNGKLKLPDDMKGLAEEKNLNELIIRMRAERDGRLLQLDKIVSNPLRFNALSEDQKELLATYRQSLLDVPLQAGFPHHINWPSSPKI